MLDVLGGECFFFGRQPDVDDINSGGRNDQRRNNSSQTITSLAISTGCWVLTPSRPTFVQALRRATSAALRLSGWVSESLAWKRKSSSPAPSGRSASSASRRTGAGHLAGLVGLGCLLAEGDEATSHVAPPKAQGLRDACGCGPLEGPEGPIGLAGCGCQEPGEVSVKVDCCSAVSVVFHD